MKRWQKCILILLAVCIGLPYSLLQLAMLQRLVNIYTATQKEVRKSAFLAEYEWFLEASKPDGVTSDGIQYKHNDGGICIMGFEAPNSLPEEYTLPETIDGFPVTRIGENAFEAQDHLRSIVLPPCLLSIEDRAFMNMTALESVDLPDSVVFIGWSAFENCASLRAFIWPKSTPHMKTSTFEGCTSLSSVTLPEGLQDINTYAFAHCTALRTLHIPASVIDILPYAFSGCAALVEFTVDENNPIYSSKNGLLLNQYGFSAHYPAIGEDTGE